MTAVKDDNRRLAQTVAELRAERRAQDRKLRDLQRQLDLARAERAERALASSAPVPELRVEVASPPPGAAPAGPAPRVVGVDDDGAEIVYEGDAAAGKQATLESEPPPPRVQPAVAARPRSPAARARAPQRDREPPGDRAAEAGNAYRAAVELVKAGQHAEGAAALRAFLARSPRHDFADNAQYWLGEAHYAQRDYPTALVEFRAVIETYPRGNKVPDALLKVGYCYLALGQPDRSRAVLEQVVTLYPKTEPALMAAKRLEAL